MLKQGVRVSVKWLQLTYGAIRRQGLRCTPFQPITNDK
jgi:hypothetical protein